jgi:protein-S-isoprenylcysteine O-methyltransferase Ste14
MQTEVTNPAGYTLTFLGGTIAFTMADIIQILGLIGLFAGLAISAWGHIINKQRTAEMRRANDIRERELNAKDD